MLYPRDVLHRVPLLVALTLEPWQNGHVAACLYPARDAWQQQAVFKVKARLEQLIRKIAPYSSDKVVDKDIYYKNINKISKFVVQYEYN